MSYNGPIEIIQEEYEDECDNCIGLGIIEAECADCQSDGGYFDGKDEWVECTKCQGNTTIEKECEDCSGSGSDIYMGTMYEIKGYDSIIIVNGELKEIEYSDDETTISSWIEKNNVRGFIWNAQYVYEEKEEMEIYLSETPDTITHIEHVPINKLSLYNMLRH